MFANVKAIIEFLKIVLTTYQWIAGQIDHAVYSSRIEAIKVAVLKAQQGALDDRLQGGSDVENRINRNAPNP